MEDIQREMMVRMSAEYVERGMPENSVQGIRAEIKQGETQRIFKTSV